MKLRNLQRDVRFEQVVDAVDGHILEKLAHNENNLKRYWSIETLLKSIWQTHDRTRGTRKSTKTRLKTNKLKRDAEWKKIEHRNIKFKD